MTMPTFSAAALASRFGLLLQGEDRQVAGVATLADATPSQLSFLANPRYRSQLAQSQAGVVVLRAEDAEACTGSALIARDPYVAFARIAALFERKGFVEVDQAVLPTSKWADYDDARRSRARAFWIDIEAGRF